jgi:peptidoglycan-associated lipoprotein
MKYALSYSVIRHPFNLSREENPMKQKIMIYPVLILMIVLFMLVTSCQKQKVATQAGTATAAQQEPQRKAEEEARQKELERQKAIEEENLEAESVKEAELSAEMEAERKLTERAVFENEDIQFEFDSIRLSAEAQEILRKKAQWLKANPSARVTIEGHCDNRGTNEYNLALGDRRAHSARVFLIDLGIAESRLQTISFGEERPLATGDNEAAWAKNRRAHFVINE